MTDCNLDPWGFECGPLMELVSEKNPEGSMAGDSELIENYVEEHLNAGGAILNVFKLLGIHEQGQILDLIGNGRAISSGEMDNFPTMSVFKTEEFCCNGWKSTYVGEKVVNNAFIGYDFGPIKNCDRTVYGIETNVNHLITTIKIKQGANARNRATKIRIERSMNGGEWYGVDVIDLIDDDKLHEYSIKQSSSSRYWRIKPLVFNGNGVFDHWHIMQFELHEYQQTRLDNIQDEFGFMESRDRDYAKEPITMKGYYDLLDSRTDLTRFGIDMSSQAFYLTVSFKAAVRLLGRPFVIGDILELPSEMQYKPNLEGVKKYLEVTDVSWSIDGYTPHWKPTLQRLVAEPILASQETLDIIGDYKPIDGSGFIDIATDNIQSMTNIAQQSQRAAEYHVPEAGSDTSEIAIIPDDVIEDFANQGINVAKVGYNERGLYIEDGLPKNGESFTEGDKYPLNPKDGDYHRLTYKTLNDNIPPRLFKWSIIKNRWIYCETDRRQQYNKIKPSLQTMLTSTTAKPIDRISKKD